jgi:hypothetical protein
MELTDMNEESPISVQDANYLMEVLNEDIADCDKSRIALLLLILAANPSLAEKGDVVGYSPRTFHNPSSFTDEEYEAAYMQCYGC